MFIQGVPNMHAAIVYADLISPNCLINRCMFRSRVDIVGNTIISIFNIYYLLIHILVSIYSQMEN